MNINFANTIEKTDLYYIQNGIGKTSLFTNFIEDLYLKNNRKISISSYYPDLFANHPLVQSSILIFSEPHNLMDKYFDNIIFEEPYFSEYNKNKNHILEVWRKLLKIEYENFEDYTDVYTNNEAKKYYYYVMENIKKPYIIVQLKGGNSPELSEKRNDGMTLRNYDNELELITKLHDTFKDHFIMVVKTSLDEYDPTINELDRICTVENENILIIQELINNCDSFIGIDSCVQHLACNKHTPKKGVVLWSNVTTPFKIGHELHINLQTESLNQLIIKHDDVINSLKGILHYV